MKRLDESRPLGVVADGRPQPFDGGIEPVLEVDEGSVGPEAKPKIVSCDDFAGLPKQHDQDFERLVLQTDSGAILAQFARANVERETPEPKSFFDRCIGGDVDHAYLESISEPLPAQTNSAMDWLRGALAWTSVHRTNTATVARAVG